SLKFQAIFLCADPFFHDVDQHGENMASKTNLIRAPLVFTKGNFVASIKRYKLEARVNNPGHKETGLIISIIARGDVDQPRIDNLTNGQYISVNTKMKNKDVLVINTIKGETGITLNGTNITHLKDRKSRFFQMLSGDNILKYSAMTGYIYMDVSPRWGAEFLGI
ncbi:MAG: phage tail family protein, partial [Eubacterium sp.]